VADDYTIIGKDLFKKETDMNLFLGLRVLLTSTGRNLFYLYTIEPMHLLKQGKLEKLNHRSVNLASLKFDFQMQIRGTDMGL
jgi:hypothetical protein